MLPSATQNRSKAVAQEHQLSQMFELARVNVVLQKRLERAGVGAGKGASASAGTKAAAATGGDQEYR